jgi:hypothetical protein
MNVPDLCDRLLEIGKQQLAAVLADDNGIENSDFPDALTPEWLADNIETIFTAITRNNANQAELVGNLEINAFLAAFQKMYQGSRGTRVNRWAKNYTVQNRMIAEGGPLAAQVRHIGIKVEDEWLVNTVPMRAPEGV